jgi:hypothetical protein
MKKNYRNLKIFPLKKFQREKFREKIFSSPKKSGLEIFPAQKFPGKKNS